MSNPIDSRFIDYLDKRLPEQEAREVEKLIETDEETRQQWQYLQVAVQAVEYAALYEQVDQVKKEYKASYANQFHSAAPSRTRKIIIRVVGIAAMALVTFGVVKYVSTNSNDLYKQGYRAYTLNTIRSGSTINDMEQAYRNSNWQQVLDAFRQSTEKDNKALFLAAMAHMELNQFEQATGLLQQVLAQNAKSGDNYFQDEAEYYMALNLLALDKIGEAITIIKKIKADPKHLYHEQAGRISKLDLSIVSFKTGK